MSKRYEEILLELVNKSSKKSRISGKQLLSLTRDFCYHVPLAPDELWVSPLLQIAKGVADNDADQKIYRTCLFLVVACLLSNKWVKNDKRKSSLLLEAMEFIRVGMNESSGSKISLLWHAFGSLASLTADTDSITLITEAVLQSNKLRTAKNSIQAESDKQLWNARIFALRRFCMGVRGQKRVPIPMQCIDPIFTAAASTSPSISQHGSALLLLAASVLSSKNGEQGSDTATLALKILTSSQSSQKSLNLTDPLSASHVLQTIAVLSTRNGVPEVNVTELNIYGFKLLHHPSPKVFSDVVKYLLSGDRAKRIISQMQSKDKDLKKTSVLSTMATECLNRLQQAGPSEKRSATVSSLALPGLLRAAMCIGKFSCDVSARYSDVKVISKLWQGVLSLHDTLVKAVPLSPHIVLESLKALTWLTQSAISKKDDEGQQWRDLKKRMTRCMPLLRLGKDPVLAMAYTKCVMERAAQPESVMAVKLPGDPNMTVHQHSEAALQLLIWTGECMVQHYRSIETILLMERVWSQVARFTLPHGSEKVKQMNLANSLSNIVEVDNPFQSASEPSKPLSASYLEDFKDLTFPCVNTPPCSTSPSPRRQSESIAAEHTVHKFLRCSYLLALDSCSSARSSDRDKDQDQAVDLMMNELALWHLAEHALLLPSASSELSALIHRLIQHVNLGPESLQQIAAASLVKLAVRLRRLTAKSCATDTEVGLTDSFSALNARTVTSRVHSSHSSDEVKVWALEMEDHVLREIAIVVGHAMGLILNEPHPTPNQSAKESRGSASNHTVVNSLVLWIREEQKENLNDNKELSRKSKHGRYIHKTSNWIQNDPKASRSIPNAAVQNLFSALLALLPTSDGTPKGDLSPVISSVHNGHNLAVKSRKDTNFNDLKIFERPREVVWVTTERVTQIKPLTTYASKDSKDTASDLPVRNNSFVSSTTDGPILSLSSIDVLGFGINDINGDTTTVGSFSSSLIPTSSYPIDFTSNSKSQRSIVSTDKSDGLTSQDVFDGYDFTNSTKTETDVVTADTTESLFPSTWLENDAPIKSEVPAKIKLTLITPTTPTSPKKLEVSDDSVVNPRVVGSSWRRGSLTTAPSLPMLFPAVTTPTGSTASSPARPIISRFQLASAESSPSKPKLTKSGSKRVLNSFTSSLSNLFSSSSSRSTDSASTSIPSVPTQEPSFQPSTSTSTPTSTSTKALTIPDRKASFQPSKSFSEIIKTDSSPRRSSAAPTLTLRDPTNSDYLFSESVARQAASPTKARSFTLQPPLMPKNAVRKIQKPPPVTAAVKSSKSRSASDAPDFLNIRNSHSQEAASFVFPSVDLTLSSFTDAAFPNTAFPSVIAAAPALSDPFTPTSPSTAAFTPTSPSTATFTASVSDRPTTPFTPSTSTSTSTSTSAFASTSASTTATASAPASAIASSSFQSSYPYPYSYQPYPTAGDPRQYYPQGSYAPQAQYAYPYPYQAGIYGNYPPNPNPGPYWPPQLAPGPGIPVLTNTPSEGSNVTASSVPDVNPFDQFIQK